MVGVSIATVSGVVHWMDGSAVPSAALGAYALLAVHTVWVLRRVGSFRLPAALVFPVTVLFFVAVFLRSSALAALRRPVRWRGRAITPSRGTS